MTSYIPNEDRLETALAADQSEELNLDFADDVRRDRLAIVWRGTVISVLSGMWIFVILSTSVDINIITHIFVPAAILVGGSYICRFFLERKNLQQATWAYALGIVITVAYLMYTSSDEIRSILPFLLVIPIYIIGLMLPMKAMPLMLVLGGAVTVGVPSALEESFVMPDEAGFFALAVGAIIALLSVQVSGELHGIAEWALESYRREREGANKLFDSRQRIERSFLRQRALTKELEETNDALHEARSAAEEAKHFRGQFLANMSHELRTPLNAVIGFSETMLNFPPMYNNVNLPDAYRQDLEQIHNSGKHLLNIINDILDLSKIDAGRLDINLQEVDLEPIFKGSMSTAVGLVGGKPIKLTRETPDEVPTVYGDPVRIRQVLLNLYSNAAKFTEEGTIRLHLTTDDKFVNISLTDTGEGISKDDLDRIFEEFRQASAGKKRARAGSGLGLAISRQLLELMGGTIWVESTLGEGSTFSFNLPIYTNQDEAENATSEPISDAVESKV